MSEQGQSENDSTSLRPVSSLRSHFERIAIPATTPNQASSSPHQPNPNGSRSGTRPKTLLSADQFAQGFSSPQSLHGVQNRPSDPSTQPKSTPSASKAESKGNTTSKFGIPGGGQRVIHHSRISSTRDGQEDRLSAAGPIGIPPATPEPIGLTSGHGASIPHPQLSGRLQTASNVSGTSNISTKAASKPRSPIPPPVNRAEKPRVPPRLAEKPTGSTLAPYSSDHKEKVSPFSTPPSSSEGSPVAQPLDVGPAIFGSRDAASQEVSRILGPDRLPAQSQPSRTTDPRKLGFAKSEKPNSTINPSAPPPLRDAHPPQPNIRAPTMPDSYQSDLSSSVPDASEHKAKTSAIGPPPPPRRAAVLASSKVPRTQAYSNLQEEREPDLLSAQVPTDGHGQTSNFNTLEDFPDVSKANRQPPYCSVGCRSIIAGEDVKLVDISGNHLCTVGHHVKVWNVNNGDLLFVVGAVDKESRPSAVAFKAAQTSRDEGSEIWIGTTYGDLREIDISKRATSQVRSGPHERREIVKIHRHQNSMWTIDDSGRLCIWSAEGSGCPNLNGTHLACRVAKGHTFSLVVQDSLWFATGKEIRIYRPDFANSVTFEVLDRPLLRPDLGTVTSGTVISSQMDRVYFGHADGKISVYSTENFACLNVAAINVYKINALVGAGPYLWVAFSIGTLSVYDTETKPWVMTKTWSGHPGHTTSNLCIDRSSFWKTGILRLVSSGSDGVLRCWNGSLEKEWHDTFMRAREVSYCSFDDLSLCVVTWNAGATTPGHLRCETEESRFIANLVERKGSPDIVVFGFQELVDLEDKKLTAKSLLKGNKRKDPTDFEHMSHQYRAWKNYLQQCMEGASASGHYYDVLHTAHLIGLFSCVFVKASQGFRVRNIDAGDIKRGMGGLHGNKGAIAIRFVVDDTSVCVVNCHLAAGQTQTSSRNSDIAAILDSSILRSASFGEPFVCGGDGSMILDHEICILNGDLNYRIDTMSRDTVVKAINVGNLPKLLDRDQLLVSRRRNPNFPLRAFVEAPITFAPTYKYDIGADSYDTSDKRRSPAWCDRILSRGLGNVKQTTYNRHDLRASDHRPVSACFRIRIKRIDESRRTKVESEADSAFSKVQEALSRQAKIQYLRDVLGVPLDEAKGLV